MSHQVSPTLRLMRQQRLWISRSLAGLMALWQIGQPLQAVDQTWTNGAANLLWSDGGNWTSGAPTVADNVILTSPIPGGLPTITLGMGSLANLLTVRDNYRLTAGDLTLTTGGISVERGNTLNLASQLLGTAGLSVTGGGTVRLAAGNTYTGITSVSNGTLVIGNQTALGTDSSAVVVTGSSTRGFAGGSLVLDGTAGGITVSRNLSLAGLGSISDRSAALVSVGNNTLSGTVNMGVGAVNTRLLTTYGNTSLTGTLDIGGTAGTTISTLGGSTNTAGSGNYILTGALTGTGTLEKAGSGTLILSPSSTSGFSGTIRLSNTSASGTTSSIRITSANVLGTRTATTTGAVLDLNGGLLEVLMDAPSVQAGGANALLFGRGNSSTIFVDHSVGGSAINGTLTFGAMAFEENTTQVFASRNGYNVTVGATPVQGGNNNSTITNNLAGGGLLTFTGAFWSNTENTANRTMNLGGNGNTLISGNVTASAAAFDHVLTKTGTGTLTLTGTAGTLDGALNIQAGTVAVNDFRAINLASTSAVTLGATTVGGTFNIVGTAPTLANLTFGTSRALSA
jgi:autotransporter-associated beta strand protein